MGIIITTLLAVTLLVFLTLGRPLARDIHSMLRSHTNYLAEVVKIADPPPAVNPDLQASFELFSRSYGFDIVLLDHRHRILRGSSASTNTAIQLSAEMIAQVDKKGIFVQNSHFNRPLIYLLPVSIPGGETGYLYLSKHFPADRAIFRFLIGLAIVGLILTLAVYPLVKSITSPLTRLTRDFEKIAAGRFDPETSSNRKDEIGELIRGYRAMSQSVNRMIISKKQLLADISHELCSPLGRIRVGTELIKEAASIEKVGKYVKNIEDDEKTCHQSGRHGRSDTGTLRSCP